MKQANRFTVMQGWKVLLVDMGINPTDVLTLAGLPADLFVRSKATISAEEMFTFWNALEQLAGEHELPLKVGQAISVEAFDPPIFAALCSPNMNVAAQRLSQYKKLIGPMTLKVEIDDDNTTITLGMDHSGLAIPRSLAATDMVFFTKLIRMGTRQNIVPKGVMLAHQLEHPERYQEFLGVSVQQGDSNRITFSAADAARPFLTENTRMWESFEPELKKRLSDLESEASTTQRVKSVLLEMLPSGETGMEQAAGRLAMSKRTLQRRLSGEGESFQGVLQDTRHQLADHYLSSSSLSPGEISFLLGFRDSNSFIRAYSEWTGTTPGQYRESTRHHA